MLFYHRLECHIFSQELLAWQVTFDASQLGLFVDYTTSVMICPFFQRETKSRAGQSFACLSGLTQSLSERLRVSGAAHVSNRQ